ncbi:hypothetical protein TBC1_112190 [Lentimicrobium saccharophilum]|uniref:Uncharacterized protein n=1 Tax=Lentimicrobium saccharophilum TaxID=1678841 RepID=A0A0S7BU96_9BACT|nr:hypothetical protein [Lentimicrobium saccharophilum]GAP44029.1 hypothetical protein TBC1_112190 [Lentimicrobium saccharophilum]
MEKPQNKQWNVVKTWIILTVLFLFGCFTPALSGIDGMNGGFAIITICGFLVICGIIVIAVYLKRARQLDRMISDDQNLARWEIDKPLWDRYIELDFSEDKSISKGTFILISVISVVIGIALSLLAGDILMLYICLGIIAILIIPAFTFPWFRKRNKLKSPALVIISEYSVYVGGAYNNWNMLGSKLDGISLDKTDKLLLMRFNMSYPARTGIEHYEIRVPVPEDREEEASRIREHFGY